MTKIGFCVIYRWKFKPGMEAQFREGWRRGTVDIRDHQGGLGSRLHRAEDDVFIAYAQWPSREAWEKAQDIEPQDPEAFKMMQEAVAKHYDPILLDVKDDLLIPFSGAAE